MEPHDSEKTNPTIHDVTPVLREKLTRAMIGIVFSRKPVWSTELEVDGEKIKQRSAVNWLRTLENSGYLKSEIVRNCKNSERRDYSPTLAGVLGVYCELYDRNGWDKQITSQILDAVEPLVNHSSFISACSKTSLWDELKRLPDFDMGVPTEGLNLEIKEDLKKGYFSFKRMEIISLQFAEILYYAARDMVAILSSKNDLVGYYREFPDLYDLKFTQTMIHRFIDHAIQSRAFYDTNSIVLADTKTMQLLMEEIIPELMKDIDKDHLIHGLKSRINDYSLVIEGYTSVLGTIEHLQ